MKGFKELLLFIIRTMAKAVIYTLAFPVVVLIRLIRPVVVVRFIPVSNRIGHAIGNISLYLAERAAGMYGGSIVEVCYPVTPIVNQQIWKMWSRVFWSPLGARWVARLNEMIPGGEVHCQPLKAINSTVRDLGGHMHGLPIQVKFTPAEEEQGAKLLRDMGLTQRPFICFYVRDNAYLKECTKINTSYHDYRDAEIGNYMQAVRELISRGNKMVRMGSIVKDKLPDAGPDAIDYSNTPWRSDFADVYLFSQCKFLIGANNGPDFFAILFKKPIIVLNVVPMGTISAWVDQSLVIFKKLWLKDDKRFLTFREIMKSDLAYEVFTQGYTRRGIELVQNTPEEIRDVSLEMDERLSGTWRTNDEFEELQRRFWSLFEPNDWNRVFRTKIGSKFLLQNKELLG